MSGNEPMVSGVWVLRGLGNTPAVMAAANGHLWLFTEDGVVVDADIPTLSVSFPRMQFDGGCVLGAGGDRVRVSFVRPNGAADVPASLFARVDGVFAGIGLLGAAGKVLDIRAGRKLGKAWKSILAPG